MEMFQHYVMMYMQIDMEYTEHMWKGFGPTALLQDTDDEILLAEGWSALAVL